MDEDRDELLRRVRAREKAAQRKMARLKRVQGAQVAGTEHDPRRDPGKVAKYTKKQLQTYEKQLNAFVSRETQFVGGRGGKPIPAKTWNAYKGAENKRNDAIQKFFDAHKGIKLPDGNTIETRLATSVYRGVKKQTAVNPLVPHVQRVPGGIRDEKALRLFLKDMKKNPGDKFIQNNLREAQDQFRKMAQEIGDKELEAAVSKLTPKQFHVMWSYTSFANSVSGIYEVLKARAMRNRQRANGEDVMDDPQVWDTLETHGRANALELSRWAKKLKV